MALIHTIGQTEIVGKYLTHSNMAENSSTTPTTSVRFYFTHCLTVLY